MICTKKRLSWCTALLTLNLMFIWGNSLLPGGISGALSNYLADALSWLFPNGGIPQSGRGLLRKLAHFGEFALLGMCLRWLFGMRINTPKLYLYSALCGVAVAFVDEGIQMFVPDRGPGLMDVGIDSLGAVLGIALLTWIHRIIIWRKQNNEKMDRDLAGAGSDDESCGLQQEGRG